MSEGIEIQGAPQPKKRASRKWLAAAAAALLVAGAGGAWYAGLFGSRGVQKTVAGKAEKYTCGMHPWIIQDHPGECPICGMKLTKIEEQPAGTTAAPAAAASGKSEADEFFSDTGSSGSAAPEGLATVRVGEKSLKLAGVQTAPAVRDRVNRTVRTVGTVVPDETRVRRVQTKIEGWVENLYTNFLGQTVRAGQPILSIYSPELLATQEEFLRAREAAEKFAASPSPDVKSLGEELLRAARRRLELFDVPKSFIANLEKTGALQRTVTLNAPVSGYVTSKDVFEGQKVEPGMALFTVTDLSRVWIEADLYEYEANAVEVGQEASLAPAYEPGAQLKGRVSFVSPFLSPESRTLKVRFEFPNPGLKLKPQMYADVSLSLAAAQGVTIPDSALIDTGVRKVAFVETAAGTFEPREVKVGVRGDGKAQVLAGVKEGEKVVVKANFLLDSESRLRAALTKMTGAGPAAGGEHAGHGGAR